MPCGVRNSNSAPNSPAACVIRSSVETTPLTCGRQASVAIKMRIRPLPPAPLRARPRTATTSSAGAGSISGLGQRSTSSAAVVVLDHQRAGFDEVAGVDVSDAVDLADDRVMDMAADDPVDAAALGFAGKLALERADEIDRVLDLELGPGRERPIGQAERPPRRVEMRVDEEGASIGPVAEDRRATSSGGRRRRIRRHG